jgi:hypothetical protein
MLIDTEFLPLTIDIKRIIRREFSRVVGYEVPFQDFFFPDATYVKYPSQSIISAHITSTTDKLYDFIKELKKPKTTLKGEILGEKVSGKETRTFFGVLYDFITIYPDELGNTDDHPHIWSAELEFEIKMTSYKMFYLNHLQSDKWISFRAEVFRKRGFLCEICYSPMNLQLHHLTYERIGFEYPADVMILCGKCHQKAHGIKI